MVLMATGREKPAAPRATPRPTGAMPPCPASSSSSYLPAINVPAPPTGSILRPGGNPVNSSEWNAQPALPAPAGVLGHQPDLVDARADREARRELGGDALEQLGR